MNLKEHFNQQVERFNHPDFITNDPISIPHQFTRKQDIEIIGFWVAMLAWGQRVTIINKSNELVDMMGGKPYDFIMNHRDIDLKPLIHFKHRTFNGDDTLYFIHFFRNFYAKHESLEEAFTKFRKSDDNQMEEMLTGFNMFFFDDENALQRTQKHVATPARRSTCKRLNMFMRWMVRKDEKGVDFGLWKNIPMSSLKIPLDVHVERVARKYGLLQRKQRDWNAVLELTEHLQRFDPEDPVKYDFALFGEGVMEKQEEKF
ncbi:TIGR02757 family protein [Portibacter marinus]|uniref:TIGR02757 family protein n=1 Tax=Portibacter marinus TaxID=2898660 RepID=UPI001F3BE782|nr:TIGR02757 family protein [Portibacter marinus]